MADYDSGIGVIEELFHQISSDVTQALITQTSEYYTQMATEIKPIFIALLGLYFIWGAIQVFLGKKNGEVWLSSAIKICFISVFAFSWGDFYNTAGEFALVSFPDFAENAFGRDINGAKGGIFSIADSVLMQLKGTINNADGITATIVAALFGLVNFIVIAAIISLFFFVYISCKIFIAVLLVMAPLFIVCLLFDRTRSYFFNWVNTLLAPLLTLFLLCLCISFISDLMVRALTAHNMVGNGDVPSTLLGGLICVTLSGFLLMFVIRIPTIAQSLVIGGLADMVGGGLHVGVTAVRNAYQRSSTRVVQQAGKGVERGASRGTAYIKSKYSSPKAKG